MPCGLVSLTMLKVAVGPCQDVSGLLQLSAVTFADEVVGCWGIKVGMLVGVLTIDGSLVNVGDAMDVSVATGVAVSVAVGGTSVLVGRAACV